MESSQSRVGGGLWNNPGVTQYSKKTQDMLRLMMQESKITNFQRKRINECLKNGAALPLSIDPTSSAPATKPKASEPVQKCPAWRPQRRTADSCRSGNSYIRQKFCPGPTKDLEKEKRRLQNIFETGQEEPTASSSKNVPACPDSVVERDRHQEVLNEIEERRQFLADMAALGQEKQYINIINIEISQKIRELEMLDKTCSSESTMTPGRKWLTGEQTEENMNSQETVEERLTATD